MKFSVSGLTKEEAQEQKKADAEWALMIKERDGWACVICGNKYGCQAHHLLPRELKDYRHALDNGISLCLKHHKFSRILSAHNNPLAFWMWMEKYRWSQYLMARLRMKDVAKDESAI